MRATTKKIKKCSDIVIEVQTRFSDMNSANKAQHFRAWSVENPVAGMVSAWVKYADRHAKQFGSGIGEDYVLGADWLKMGLAIRGLLNGELYGLDAGTVDAIIHECLIAQGFEEGKDW